MKHLKRIFESSEDINEDMIVTCFAYVFDLASSYEIFESSVEELDSEEDYDCFSIDIEHDFYDESSVTDFKKYLEILLKIDEAIEKLQKIYKVDIIQFSENYNSKITINIANR